MGGLPPPRTPMLNSDLSPPCVTEMANEINQAFLGHMTEFVPLLSSNRQTNTQGRSEACCASQFSVQEIDPTKSK